jgi:hypothetical protein
VVTCVHSRNLAVESRNKYRFGDKFKVKLNGNYYELFVMGNKKINKSFLKIYKTLLQPLRRGFVSYICRREKAESLPQIVHLVLLKGRVTNALPSP